MESQFLKQKLKQAQQKAQLQQREKIIKQKEELLENKTIASPSTSYENRRKKEKLFLCPLTMELMNDPVTTPCCHRFNKTAILQNLKTSKKCPYFGCGSLVTPKDLKSDSVFKELIQIFKQKQLKSQMKEEKRTKLGF